MTLAYAILCVAGTVLPYVFFGGFVAQNGWNLQRFIAGLFANGAAAGFTADLLISSVAFWCFMYFETRTRPVKAWWLAIVANLLVGLSLALPLFLLLRERARYRSPLNSAA
jgi:hypothetical protein